MAAKKASIEINVEEAASVVVNGTSHAPSDLPPAPPADPPAEKKAEDAPASEPVKAAAPDAPAAKKTEDAPAPEAVKAATPTVEAAVESAPPKAMNLLEPKGTWPPPIYLNENASAQERYYMEHRWYTQWSYYDSKASQAKSLYQRFQLAAAIGAAAVTAVVALSPIAPDVGTRNVLTVLTVIISLMVTSATTIEAVKNYGDAWRTYRAAAEELKREKSLYDVHSGPYRKSKVPFLLFAERCEEIMEKQNGGWAAAAKEESGSSGGQQAAPAADRDGDGAG